MKKWTVAKYDRESAKILADECDTDPIIALIAASRGYDEPGELEQFLCDEPIFSNPFLFADIEKAAGILNQSVKKGEKIAVFGDYDCDGITATALMYKYLVSRGADCIYYIPDRFSEGYGMNTVAVEQLKQKGVDLIITVDNGIACKREIDLAKTLGMKVIVTDHHLPGDILPDADAVVDPHRNDCPSEFKEICGAQVAFALICVAENREPEELLPYFADLLSVAVLADVMPLKYENRYTVKCGIEKIKTSPNIGISAILNVAGLNKNEINSAGLSFGICPRINATGRMGSASTAVDLLLSDNIKTALEIAGEVDSLNSLRQKTEKEVFLQAEKKIEQNGYSHRKVIVVEGENWHLGVVGIVASSIAEKYGRPAIVISVDGEEASGSGRSIEGFSIFEALKNCSDLLSRFGGHTLAAGIGIKTCDIVDFREKINEYAGSVPAVVPELKLDCRLNPAAITTALTDNLKLLEPFGNENPVPIFGLYGVTLERITPIGKGKHLRLTFSKSGVSFSGLLFGISADKFCFEEGDLLDLAVNLDENIYNGEKSVTVKVKGIRMSGTDDDTVFLQIADYDLFLSGGEYDPKNLFPAREEIGEIYKYIAAKPRLKDRIKYRYLNSIGYAKTETAINILTELNLIVFENGLLKKSDQKEKKDLNNSKTYSVLKKGAERDDRTTT